MMRWVFLLILSMSYAADIKICLSLLVQNNETKIEQCLKSIPDWVDCVSMYAHGADDQTLAMAREFFIKNGILGTIHRHSENHPGVFQTKALRAAQKVIEMHRWPLETTYILCLDTSQILNVSSSFEKSSLFSADCHSLLQQTDSFSSYEPCLFRAHLPWSYEAEAALWSCIGDYQSQKCKTLSLEKQEMTSQETAQLIHELERAPKVLHNLFCLAQLYRQAEEYEKAIACYQQRIEEKGDFEEYWFSHYMIGESYEKLDKWDEALHWYLETYQIGPDRADPLLKISIHYRLLGYNDLAYIFAKFGSLLSACDNQKYFSPRPIENYQFEEELSIVSYYTQFREDGYEAASHLVLKKGLPFWRRDHAYRNLLFYVEPIAAESYQLIEVDLPFAAEGVRYHPMNPSILKTLDGYTVICRAVNYVQKGAKEFQTYDQNGIYRSRNFVLQYDPHFRLLSQRELIESPSRKRIGTPSVQGLEDCRIFEFRGVPWFTCTTTDTNPTGSFQISLGKIGQAAKDAPVEFFIPLKGPDPYRCEKNWLPFVYEDQLRVIYQYDPFTVYAPDLTTGNCECVYSYLPDHDFSSFRGSAGPLTFDDGYLILVHEVAFLPDFQRAYMHRFIFLNRDWIVTRISKPFVFKHTGVEYCCSMSFDHRGVKLILGVGIEDKEAYLCTVDGEVVRAMLRLLETVN